MARRLYGDGLVRMTSGARARRTHRFQQMRWPDAMPDEPHPWPRAHARALRGAGAGGGNFAQAVLDVGGLISDFSAATTGAKPRKGRIA